MEYKIKLFCYQVLEKAKGYLGISEKDSEMKITSEDEIRLVFAIYVGFNGIMYFIIPFYIFLLWIFLNILIFFILKYNFSQEMPRFRDSYRYQPQETLSSTFFENEFSGVDSYQYRPATERKPVVQPKPQKQKQKPQETITLKDSKRKIPKRSIYARFPDSDSFSDSDKEEATRMTPEEYKKQPYENRRMESSEEKIFVRGEFLKTNQNIQLGTPEYNEKFDKEDYSEIKENKEEIISQKPHNRKSIGDFLNRLKFRNIFAKKTKVKDDSAMEIEEESHGEDRTENPKDASSKASIWSKVPGFVNRIFKRKDSIQKVEVEALAKNEKEEAKKDQEQEIPNQTIKPEPEATRNVPKVLSSMNENNVNDDPLKFYSDVKNEAMRLLLETHKKRLQQDSSENETENKSLSTDNNLRFNENNLLQGIEALVKERLSQNEKSSQEPEEQNLLNKNQLESENQILDKSIIESQSLSQRKDSTETFLVQKKELIKKPIQPNPLSMNLAARRNPLNRKTINKVDNSQINQEVPKENIQSKSISQNLKTDGLSSRVISFDDDDDNESEFPVLRKQKNNSNDNDTKEPQIENKENEQNQAEKSQMQAVNNTESQTELSNQKEAIDVERETTPLQRLKELEETKIEKEPAEVRKNENLQNTKALKKEIPQEEITFENAYKRSFARMHKIEKKLPENSIAQNNEKVVEELSNHISHPDVQNFEEIKQDPSIQKNPEVLHNDQMQEEIQEDAPIFGSPEGNNEQIQENINIERNTETFEAGQNEEQINIQQKPEQEELNENNQPGWDSLSKYFNTGNEKKQGENPDEPVPEQNFMNNLLQSSSLFTTLPYIPPGSGYSESPSQSGTQASDFQINDNKTQDWDGFAKQEKRNAQQENNEENNENNFGFANSRDMMRSGGLLSKVPASFGFLRKPVNYEEIYKGHKDLSDK